MPVNPDSVLCYVDAPWAWFTTRPLDQESGCEWDRAGYDYRAEPPFGPEIRTGLDSWDFLPFDEQPDYHPDGTPKWEIYRVVWQGDFLLPSANSREEWSVNQINRRLVPWLRPSESNQNPRAQPIWAGTTLAEFVRLISEGGGRAYLPAETT